MNWSVYEIESTWNDNDVLCIHVVPNYGPEHTMIGDTCDCKPTIEYQPNGNAVIFHKGLYVVSNK